MLDKSEVGKRGYLTEDYRLFHLRDNREVKLDYHYHEFDKIVLQLSGRVSFYDPKAVWTVGETFESKSVNTPFAGAELTGTLKTGRFREGSDCRRHHDDRQTANSHGKYGA